MNGDMNTWSWVFVILKFFVWTKIHHVEPHGYTNRPCVWGSSCWSWWSREIIRIWSIKYKEKIDPEGLEKGTIDVKNELKNQPFVSDGPIKLVSSYWHDKLVLSKFDVFIGIKELLRYVFTEKYSSWLVIPF